MNERSSDEERSGDREFEKQRSNTKLFAKNFRCPPIHSSNRLGEFINHLANRMRRETGVSIDHCRPLPLLLTCRPCSHHNSSEWTVPIR